jgi:hypothetical protein
MNLRSFIWPAAAAVGYMVIKRMMKPAAPKPPTPPSRRELEIDAQGLQRRGDDAVYRASLTAAEVRQGKLIEVPSPDGPQGVQVPAGVAPGTRLRLRGLGYRAVDGTRGDLYVIVAIDKK